MDHHHGSLEASPWWLLLLFSQVILPGKHDFLAFGGWVLLQDSASLESNKPNHWNLHCKTRPIVKWAWKSSRCKFSSQSTVGRYIWWTPSCRCILNDKYTSTFQSLLAFEFIPLHSSRACLTFLILSWCYTCGQVLISHTFHYSPF